MPASENQWTWQCDELIPNDTGIGREMLDNILCRLGGLQWNEHEIFGVRLAVHEALENAFAHGNAMDAAKHVRFACRISPTKIRVEITDEGAGFDPDHLPDPTSPPRLGCPRGRGVLLMRAFMSHVEFQHGGSRVVLEKSGPASPGPVRNLVLSETTVPWKGTVPCLLTQKAEQSLPPIPNTRRTSAGLVQPASTAWQAGGVEAASLGPLLRRAIEEMHHLVIAQPGQNGDERQAD